jgi:hypothetical protein
MSLLLLCFLLSLAILAALGWSRLQRKPQITDAMKAAAQPQAQPPRTLKEVLALSPAELQQCDIALLNLLCAEGLPGAEGVSVQECLSTLDQWAQWAKSETDRHFYRFRKDPADYENSEGYFRMLMLAMVVYDDFKVRYNPRWIAPPQPMIENDHFFGDAHNVFLHGLTGPLRMGTCSSMPVLYVALGRRMGYPLKLVSTKGHLFLRWDSPTDRFDVDGTAHGMNRYDDARYKQWPHPITDEEATANGYLKSMTPAEELSVFLAIRAGCLSEAGRTAEAVAAATAACRQAPNWQINHEMLARAQEQYAGASAEAILKARPTFNDRREELRYVLWEAETLSRLKRAEMGIPEKGPPLSLPVTQ